MSEVDRPKIWRPVQSGKLSQVHSTFDAASVHSKYRYTWIFGGRYIISTLRWHTRHSTLTSVPGKHWYKYVYFRRPVHSVHQGNTFDTLHCLGTRYTCNFGDLYTQYNLVRSTSDTASVHGEHWYTCIYQGSTLDTLHYLATRYTCIFRGRYTQ